jgi:phosphate transport system protein
VNQRNAFDNALQDLQQRLLRMGCTVQDALANAVESLKVLDAARAQSVVERDPLINKQQQEIEEICIRLIATQQPVAKDLRKIVAGMRIAADLERMGDLAVDVARSAIRLQGQALIKPLVDIPKMAQAIDTMISDAIQAYTDNSVELAKKLAEEDDVVDHLYRGMVEELLSLVSDDPKVLAQAITLAFVGRYLERIGDHATNIGESVIYIISGEWSDLN